jgi:hypothetical protein
MIAKFGPLGFRPDDRYRNIAEARIVAMLVLAGWPHEPESREALEGARTALAAWVGNGLGFQTTPQGERCFDPVEVYNHMKLAGVEERDGFFFEKFSRARRDLVQERAAQNSPRAGPGGGERMVVDFQRTFHLGALDPASKLRLRLPRPLNGDGMSDVEVTPLAETVPDAQVKVGPERIEARLAAAGRTTATVGVRMSFTVQRPAPVPRAELVPPDPATYLATQERLIVVSDRIRDLAQSLADTTAPALEVIGALWEYIHAELRCGMVHYDQVDPRSPGDWVLDSGWSDCQLASALFVAMCRAHGIAARLVGGYLLYPAAPTNHFWAEAWIEGQGWLPFDFFGWDLSDGGRRREWRDRFFGRLEPRLITERLPREFTGALGVPIPPAWCILQTPAPGGVEISFMDIDGRPIYDDLVRVRT